MKSTKSWIRKGQRVNKLKNRDHKWGQGKVHWVIYIGKKDPRNAGAGYYGTYYVKACQPDHQGDHMLGGTDWGNVPKDEPITCLHCLKL